MRILVISAQELFRQSTQAACLRYGESLVSVRLSESVGQGLELAEQFQAEVVFLDLTRSVEAGMLAIEQLAASRIQRLVIASIDKASIDLMTRAVRAGAREFIAQPVQDDDVHAVLRKARQVLVPALADPGVRGKIYVVFSSKGGVGKTTLACNLSVLLAQRSGVGRVAMVDANTQAPNVAPMLDLQPERWLRDAVEQYRRLDGDMLRQFMTPHESGALVLAHSSENPLGLDFEEDQLGKILLVAKGHFDHVIVDTFPVLSSLNLAVMDLADEILLVTEPVVPALRSARHNLQVLKQAGYGPERIQLVINRFSRFRGNVPIDLVSETLDWPVHAVLPYDMHATIAANNGQPVVTMFPESIVAKGIGELLDRLTGQSDVEPTPPMSLRDRLLRLLRGY
ncbi:AAA family ATPase [Piscinibacter sp. Jin2]|uniref:AAA family ATPase n=1 Tax=Aquariibacter lacus TaxID=2801332 RepID=A0A9X0XCZ2_9BURK|nr:P-loop NTPase [Piscinibacter lacus]MBL0719244.1 AAA family ATPase [Piscinibacter lacus]